MNEENELLCKKCKKKKFIRVMGDGYCTKHGVYSFYKVPLRIECIECAKEKSICQGCGNKL